MVKFNYKKNTDDDVQINLMPLIDIIFNLLIFFLITAAITTKGIKLDLPKASTSEKLPSRSWEIIIDQKGEIVFNEAVITMDRLESIMRIEKERPRGEKVSDIVLKAHKDVPFGKFVRIMDIARANGLLNLVIATDPKKE